jgi:hypothetical protein
MRTLERAVDKKKMQTICFSERNRVPEEELQRSRGNTSYDENVKDVGCHLGQ